MADDVLVCVSRVSPHSRLPVDRPSRSAIRRTRRASSLAGRAPSSPASTRAWALCFVRARRQPPLLLGVSSPYASLSTNNHWITFWVCFDPYRHPVHINHMLSPSTAIARACKLDAGVTGAARCLAWGAGEVAPLQTRALCVASRRQRQLRTGQPCRRCAR
jgi:hypothetical protein